MNRIPLWGWAAALGAIVGGAWLLKKRQTTSPASAASAAAAPAFSQQQQVQDFQIFSALTSAQQGSDLNFVGQMLSLFAGGAAPGSAAATGGGAGVPAASGPQGAGFQSIGPSQFAQEGPNFVGRGPQGVYAGIPNQQQAAADQSAGMVIYTYSPQGGFQPVSANEPNTIPGEFVQVSGSAQ